MNQKGCFLSYSMSLDQPDRPYIFLSLQALRSTDQRTESKLALSIKRTGEKLNEYSSWMAYEEGCCCCERVRLCITSRIDLAYQRRRRRRRQGQNQAWTGRAERLEPSRRSEKLGKPLTSRAAVASRTQRGRGDRKVVEEEYETDVEKVRKKKQQSQW